MTTVKQAGPDDLIATIWFGLGFRPSDSLVLAGLEGPRQRVGVLVRADLPGRPSSWSRLRALVRSSLDPILDSPAHAVVALIASEQAITGPEPRVVQVLIEFAERRGLDVFDVIGVTSTAYRSLICDDQRCCPNGGNPIAAVMSSRAAASHVLNGDTVAASVEDLLADVLPDDDDDATAGAGPDLGRQPGRKPPRLTPAERLMWWERWNEALTTATEGLLGPAPLFDSAPLLGGLSRALYDPYLRDAVLMQLLGASAAQLSTMLLGHRSSHPKAGFHPKAKVPDAEGKVPDAESGPDAEGQSEPDLGALLGRCPDDQRLAPGIAVLAGAARVAAPGSRAPSLAVLAMLAWYQGKSGRSRLLVERARADYPVSLTGLVADLLLRRLPPPWARTKAPGALLPGALRPSGG